MLNTSTTRKVKIEGNLQKFKKEFRLQKTEIKRMRESFMARNDKDTLFNNIDAPLLSENDRKNEMKNRLLYANRQGNEAELFGNNIQVELHKDQHKFDVIGENVTPTLIDF